MSGTITVESLAFLHKSADQTTFSIDLSYSAVSVRPQLIEWTIYSGAATTLCPGSAGQTCEDKIYKGESIIGASDCPVASEGEFLSVTLAIDNASVIDNLCYDGYLTVKAIGRGVSSSDDNALSVPIWKSPEPCTLDNVSFTRGDVSGNESIRLDVKFSQDVEPCSFTDDEITYTGYMQVISSLGSAVMVTQEDLVYNETFGGVYIDVSHTRITDYTNGADEVEEILVALVKNRQINDNGATGVVVSSVISNTLNAQDATRPSAPDVVITNYQQEYGDVSEVYFNQNEYMQQKMSIAITPGFNNTLVDVTNYECKIYVDGDDDAKDTISVDASENRIVTATFDLSSWATADDDGKLLTIEVTPQAQYVDSSGATQTSATGYASNISDQYVHPGTAVAGFAMAGGLVDLTPDVESVNLSVDFLWGDADERDNVKQSDIKFLLFAEDKNGVVQNLGMREDLLLKADGTKVGGVASSILNYGSSSNSVTGIGYDQLDNGAVQGLNVELKSAVDGEDILVDLFGDLQLLSSTKFYLVAAQPLKTGYGYQDGFYSYRGGDDNVYGYGSRDVLLSAPVSVTLNSISSAPTLERINGIDIGDEAAWAVSNIYRLTGYAAQHVKEASMVVQYLTKEDNTHYKTHSLIPNIFWQRGTTDTSKWTFVFNLDLKDSDEELHVITLAGKDGGFLMVRNPDHISA